MIVAMVETVPSLCVCISVCVHARVHVRNFVTRKPQIIAHEMLFIQSSSSVTIPLLQHSTAYWRNTTEQISVKITVCKSHKGGSLQLLVISDFTFFPAEVLVVSLKKECVSFF